MQNIKNIESKTTSPFFLPPSHINPLIAYLNNEKSADFLGFPAWLKHQGIRQSEGQHYADILKTIYTHWKDYSHQYKFPQLSLFIAHVTNQFSATLTDHSFSGSASLSVAKQFFDALENLIDKGIFKADKEGGAKARLELDRLLSTLANITQDDSEEFTAKLSSGAGAEIKAKSFPLEEAVSASQLVKLIMTMGIQSSQTINLPLIVNAIAALGSLSRSNLLSGYASIDTLLQLVGRFLPKSHPFISSQLLAGLVDLAETDRLKTSLKVSFINDILKNLQAKTSEKASILDAVKKLRALAENLAIEQIEFLDMGAVRNILANFVKEPSPSVKELADMIQSVARIQAFTELPTTIKFEQFLSLLELAVRQAKQETASEGLIANISRIILSVGELIKNKPNLYGHIEGSNWLQWIEQCFLKTESVIEKEIEKLGDPDQCSITLLKTMINTLRAGILLGSVAGENLFNIIKINSEKIIADEEGLQYVRRLALYARVARVKLPTAMQDLLVSGKPKLPLSDEKLQAQVDKALKDALYKEVEMELGDLYPSDNSFKVKIRGKSDIVDIELNGEQFHVGDPYFRNSVVLWIGQAQHVVDVNLKFQRTPAEIIKYALEMAEKDNELPPQLGVSWSQFLSRKFRRPASALTSDPPSTAPVESKLPASTSNEKQVVQPVKREQALPQASTHTQNPVMDEKKLTAKSPAPIKTLKEFTKTAKAGDLEAVKHALNKGILVNSATNKIDSNVQISILLQIMAELRTNSTASVVENLSKICEIFIERASIASLTTHEVSTSSPKISPLVVALQFSQNDIVQLIKKKFTDGKKSISLTQNLPRKKGKKKKNLRPSLPKTWEQIIDNSKKTVANLSEITQNSKFNSKAEAEVTPTGEEKKPRGVAPKLSAPLPDHTPSIPDLVADDIISPDKKTSQNEIALNLQSFNFRKFQNKRKLKRLAAKGNTQAQLLLGIMYYEGLGVTEDNNKAMQWLTPAAKLNHPVALYRLGLCKLDDDSLKNKYEQAFELFKLSASQNNAGAQYELARLYFTGSGVEKDLQKAIYWLQLAANQGVAEAECYLGDCFEEGLGVEMDLSKAREYFQRAAKQNFPAAQSQLGSFYMDGTGGPQDLKVGIRLIKAAAQMGDRFAQKNLGMCYDEGRGVEKDKIKAILYLELAAAQGEPTAEFEMARRYHHGGLGVPVDLNKAILLYTSSAAKDNGFAQFNLAKCYYEGIGVPPDLLRAHNLFKSAAAQGNEKAKAVLQVMFSDNAFRRIILAAENKESIGRSIRTATQTGSPIHTSASAGNEQITQPISPCISVSGGPTKLF